MYAPRTKYGYGQMYCYASNKVGEQKDPCIFNVIPAGPPTVIKNCLVGNQSMESLVVKCEPGDDGGLEQSFFLEVYHSGSRSILHSNLSSSKWPVFEVTDLPMSTPLVLVLYAANSKGRSDSVALTASTLPYLNKGQFSSPISLTSHMMWCWLELTTPLVWNLFYPLLTPCLYSSHVRSWCFWITNNTLHNQTSHEREPRIVLSDAACFFIMKDVSVCDVWIRVARDSLLRVTWEKEYSTLLCDTYSTEHNVASTLENLRKRDVDVYFTHETHDGRHADVDDHVWRNGK